MVLEMNLKDILSENLARYRKAKNWTQYDVAEETGLAVDTVRSYEQGRAWPRHDQFEALAKALGVHPFQLLQRRGEMKITTPQEVLGLLRDALVDPDVFEQLCLALATLPRKK